jgi:hypothetical protein
MRPGAAPDAQSAWAAFAENGACAPHRSSPSSTPAFARIERATAKRQLGLVETDPVRHPFLDERERLHGLRRGPVESEPVRAPDRRDQQAVPVRHGYLDLVARFDGGTPHDFDIGHGTRGSAEVRSYTRMQ